MKITPAFFSSSLKVVATETESNTASTATRLRRLDAGQDFLLAQRDAELLVGLQDLGIDLVEGLRRRVHLRRGVVVDVVVVDRLVLTRAPRSARAW